jgi:hypothetical protein
MNSSSQPKPNLSSIGYLWIRLSPANVLIILMLPPQRIMFEGQGVTSIDTHSRMAMSLLTVAQRSSLAFGHQEDIEVALHEGEGTEVPASVEVTTVEGGMEDQIDRMIATEEGEWAEVTDEIYEMIVGIERDSTIMT